MSSTVVAGRHRAAPAPAPAPQRPAPASAPAAPAVRRPLSRRLLALTANVALVLGLLMFLLIALGPHLFGYRTSTMLTGSMEPSISPGDVVVTVERPAADVEVGDVISYHIPVEDHRVETHRVVEVIHHPDGTVAVRTKGDDNENADPWTATLEGDTVWEMTAVVPKVGSAIRALRAPAVQHGIFWVAIGGLLVTGLGVIWSKDRTERDERTEERS